MPMKVCSRCKKEKIISDFRKRKASKDGFRANCKECEDSRYVYTCVVCGEESISSRKNQLYCSRKCSNYVRRNRVVCNCEICNKKFEIKKSVYDKYEHHYCSLECKALGFGRFFSGDNNSLYTQIEMACEVCFKKFNINKYRETISTHHYCSYECQAKGFSLFFSKRNHPNYGRIMPIDQKFKISKAKVGKYMGEESPRWNPNLTKAERIANKTRHSNLDYKAWIKQIFMKDNYTCQCCNQRGVKLVAHHLDGYNWCIEKRIDSKNGTTLCEKCHKEFHFIYGYGNNTDYQYREFIKNKKSA